MTTNLQLVPSSHEQTIEDAFPNVECPIMPLGNRVLVQLRLPKQKTKSGLILTSDTRDDSYRNEQTAKVIAVGAGCFKFPSTGLPWPEGERFATNDYVRCALHGGDNHWVPVENDAEQTLVLFKTFKDYEIIGLIRGNPLNVKTHAAYF